MTDICEHLRLLGEMNDWSTAIEAADEIERLRDQVDEVCNSLAILAGFVNFDALSLDDRAFVEQLTERFHRWLQGDRP